VDFQLRPDDSTREQLKFKYAKVVGVNLAKNLLGQAKVEYHAAEAGGITRIVVISNPVRSRLST
jgi:hypothetical protein